MTTFYQSALYGQGALNIGEITAPSKRYYETDGLPEFVHYRDEGCEFSPTCLSCRLPACRFDMPPKLAGALVNEQRIAVMLAAGRTADDIAAELGMSRRSVFRHKRNLKSGGRDVKHRDERRTA